MTLQKDDASLMFSAQFDAVSAHQIAESVATNGYFVFEKALTDDYVNALLAEIDFDRVSVNTNDVGVVFSGPQRFLTHCLAVSQLAYEVTTARKVLDICNAYFQERYKLTNHRVYKNTRMSHMPWHTDNNRQTGDRLTSKHTMPGLLFIFYLTDMTQNAFQYVKGSQHWSQNHDEIYLSDRFIEQHYQDEIETFPLPKGSFIICNIHGVHRAEPFRNKNYSRSILLFQVDQVGNGYVGHGEKNLVNTAYITDPTPELMDYLGFGFRTDYPAFPNTSIATMLPQDILALQRQIMPQMVKAIAKTLVKSIVPEQVMIDVKRMRWQLRDVLKPRPALAKITPKPKT